MEIQAETTYTDLTAIQHVAKKLWQFRCVCEKLVVFPEYRVLSGHTKSCGCRRYRVSAEFRAENQWNKDRIAACSRCEKSKPHTEFRKQYRSGVSFPRAWCRICDNETRNAATKKTPEARLAWAFRTIRNKCGRQNIPFDLTFEDFLPIPTICPAYKTPMNYDGDRDQQPTFDRIIPELGYVKGNVWLISHRANRMKSDGTLAEHEQLVEWLKSVLTPESLTV